MKLRKWLVYLSVIVAVGILIVTSIFNTGSGFGRIERRNLHEIQGGSSFPFLDQNLPAVTSVSLFISLAIVGILILFVFPERIRRVAEAVPASASRLVRQALLGLLIFVLVAATSLISVLTLGTFPLAVILSAGLFVSGLIGSVALSFSFGRWLVRRAGWGRASPVVFYLLGLLVLFSLTRIPWAGPVFTLILLSLALGAAIASHFGSGRPWNLNPLMEEQKDDKSDR